MKPKNLDTKVIVDFLVDNIDPDFIVLFDSYATGDYHKKYDCS